jgi:hypothetical protein
VGTAKIIPGRCTITTRWRRRVEIISVELSELRVGTYDEIQY